MDWRISGVMAAAVLGVASAALGADARDLTGNYRFITSANGPDGKPVCTEQWTLGADGSLLIVSGEERIEGRWRTEKRGSENWLVQTERRSNHAPDCQGDVSAETAPEASLYFWVANSGWVNICQAPQLVNGTPYVSACYAYLIPQR